MTISLPNIPSDTHINSGVADASSTTPVITFRDAVLADADVVADMVNSAYRGDSSRQGWTTEADLLQGARTNADEIRDQIAAAGSFILLCLQDQAIVGCVHLEQQQNAAYFGMFVVRPQLQGKGIGKQFMQQAESAVQQRWGVTKIWMTVISVRHELLAYYERRGYVRTGRLSPFPVEERQEILLAGDLQFEELEKLLPHKSS
ncbi:GNAT family N-acetyltransferase [Undibacterium sp. RTI2.1]|uniref:GNAT family N-acetyltransferase n=1 Tax=unclassified Undibacterium TaxID=2630295 RepID=UPI002AB359FA|nr:MULTISPECIES: GNAT family N-acetyltransferase [unclassified Undibacterium]MDY7539684.1 GNAT family N-acetyltransferase [Undibacterium sp. 5I1]MEB0030701.1 GNAT family N-acetyltransferase [Undibacterium sp. RTI2.1]MEB0117180.1 GNAT family N-acetyltransferase [Undibacterium sp. RTI2.2]MEB0230886.1 GNAT family N-acetyltransferase [Undibacterium sp. 10I3]MEB0257459.1 GNAT family N-acetyltransferase [Undibacterium sp. 5I1]